MKKIINGKMYNTETAEYLGSWDNGLSNSDFHVISEFLYKTRKGTYFIHGKGGAMTKYADRAGSMYCEGERITPISEEEARRWAENNLSAENYADIFGEPEEA